MDLIALLAGIIFYVGWCAVNGLLAAAKDRNALLIFVLSIFLSPLLIWLYIGFVPAREQEDESP